MMYKAFYTKGEDGLYHLIAVIPVENTETLFYPVVSALLGYISGRTWICIYSFSVSEFSDTICH